MFNPVEASQTKLASPPNAPELLYCTCVFEPPGNPPTVISFILGLVPSSAVALIILVVLSVVPHVTLEPEPQTYLNSTVYQPLVAFSI